jgi:hypothetical protein
MISISGQNNVPSNSYAGVGISALPNFHIVWVGSTLADFTKRLQAHEIRSPLRAAVVHEFDLLFPTALREKQDRRAICLSKIKRYFRPNSLFGAAHAQPLHPLGRR